MRLIQFIIINFLHILAFFFVVYKDLPAIYVNRKDHVLVLFYFCKLLKRTFLYEFR